MQQIEYHNIGREYFNFFLAFTDTLKLCFKNFLSLFTSTFRSLLLFCLNLVNDDEREEDIEKRNFVVEQIVILEEDFITSYRRIEKQSF